MRVAFVLIACVASLAIPRLVKADASDGELFGYVLNSRYVEEDSRSHDDTRMVLIAAQSPVKPAAIDTVYVLVTPISRSIGKVVGETWFEGGEDAIVAYEKFRSILRNKYSDWSAEEQSDVHYQISRFRQGDYSLSVQVSGPHREPVAATPAKPFQLLISLAYHAASPSAVELELLANEEIKQAVVNNFSEEESQGL